MQILTYIFETELAFSDPVRDHSFVLRCQPKPTSTQKVMESQLFTWPRIPLTEQVDGFGNRLVVGWCPQKHQRFNFYATGQVMVSHEDAAARPAHPVFAQPTLLTMPDEAMKLFAREILADFSESKAERRALSDDHAAVEHIKVAKGIPASDGIPPIDTPPLSELPMQDRWEAAKALCHGVYDHFSYVPGATTTMTTAAEAFALGEGVCQDYAQVLVSLCRLAGMPARYVTGLMMGEGATHAWVEIHDGVRWRALDPTNDRICDDGYMLFCTGRDFDDCPIERGVFTGNASQTQTVTAKLGVNVLDLGEGAKIASAPALAEGEGLRGMDISLMEAIQQ